MKSIYNTLLFLLKFATLGLALAFVVNALAPRATERLRASFGQSAHESAAAPATANTSQSSTNEDSASVAHSANDHEREYTAAPVSYADAVSRAAPAVVNIYANKVITTRQVLVPPSVVWQRLLGGISVGPTYQQRRPSLGSGVIVSTDGYVLTNNHVIEGADEIQMQLYDGRIAKASVVGTDTDTDLAVLKIDAGNLPSITIADKTPLNVGDVVLAIGNPFGLGKTVTMGIVSAIGRQQRALSTYEDFIQTDAAINAGNSGGALANAYGELVGINTAMFEPDSGAQGIGFAIPVATAKTVLDQIVAHGMVVRGWLGAEYVDSSTVQTAVPAGASNGVVVLGVYKDSPAAHAGLQRGDVLLQLNDDSINSQTELRNREAALTPGSNVQISGQRSGMPFKVTLTVMQRPQQQQHASG